MMSTAVLFLGPEQLALRELALVPPAVSEPLVEIEVEWSAISTGTERLLFTGKMPPFPGLAYPLVPGYESVGRVVRLMNGDAAAPALFSPGDRVFVPGASCFGDVRGLFGGAASRLIVATSKVRKIEGLAEEGVLLALAATAKHALGVGPLPELIVGHGALGRLLARLAVSAGGSPVVWEKNPARAEGAVGYSVVSPDDDTRRDYRTICDVSGDPALVEPLIGRLAKGGELVLAGFYPERVSFAFPLAFMKEARLRVAAEWAPADLDAVLALIANGRLDLSGLLTHRHPFEEATAAYNTAFTDPSCLKMLVDWRHTHHAH